MLYEKLTELIEFFVKYGLLSSMTGLERDLVGDEATAESIEEGHEGGIPVESFFCFVLLWCEREWSCRKEEPFKTK